MNKIASLLAATLLLASSSTWAQADRSADLRYCLDLPSSYEIAKCSGEISPGEKSKPLSRAEVERTLAKTRASVPGGADESSGTPATASDQPGKDSLPENTERSAN